MKNQLIFFVIALSFLSTKSNAQMSDGVTISLRIAPSVGSLIFDSDLYEEESIKGALFFGDDRNLMSLIMEIGKATDPQHNRNNNTVNYYNFGLQRCMVKTKQERRLTSSLFVGLSAYVSKHLNHKSNCSYGYSDGWGAPGLYSNCNPTVEKYDKILIGLPINYYLKFKAMNAFALTVGCHSTILSTQGYSLAFSLGIELGK